MRNSVAKYLYFFCLLITTHLVAGCGREGSEISSARISLIFNLVQLAETDSSITFAHSFRRSIGEMTPSFGEGRSFRLNLSETLVSISPVVDSNLNFVALTLTGSPNTVLDTIISGVSLGNGGRGVRISPLVRNDSTLVEYQFTIKKGVPYLYYNSFIFDLCVQQLRTDGVPLRIKLNEYFVAKEIQADMQQISNLMDTVFRASNSSEITNLCGTITSSYEFYRDRPVKLLYYPL
jgi:hypothetical protein